VTRLRRLAVLFACCAVLSACATRRSPTSPAAAPEPWDRRIAALKHTSSWQLDGRAAAALGQQGWQASLDWRQSGDDSEVHLAGPLGVGATVLKLTPGGLSVNGSPPSDAMVAELQERLGFELPIEHLRFWLLGIPDPRSPFELTRNAQDRAAHLSQAGWSIDYDRYLSSQGDLLPGHLVLTRDEARVRIAIESWKNLR
jgi:outer membrane lipoprotein LolB